MGSVLDDDPYHPHHRIKVVAAFSAAITSASGSTWNCTEQL
jgi:hypothetical protein